MTVKELNALIDNLPDNTQVRMIDTETNISYEINQNFFEILHDDEVIGDPASPYVECLFIVLPVKTNT